MPGKALNPDMGGVILQRWFLHKPFRHPAPWLLTALLSLTWPAAAADEPDVKPRVAFVLEASAEMIAPWQGRTRLEAAVEALGRELAALPLTAEAAVWAAGPDGPSQLIAPAEAQALKRARLVKPTAHGRPDLATAAREALAWAADGRPGAVVLICSGQAGGLDQAILAGEPPGADGPFTHVVAMGPSKALAPGLMRVTLLGGGKLLTVEAPNRARLVLHRATQTALSPASLLAAVRDAANQPLELTYKIMHPGGSEKFGRPALANRPAQLPPGAYALAWPKDSAIGPGQPPQIARVAARGQTIVRAGGAGRLILEAKGENGQDLPWRVNVTSVPGGRLLATNQALPATIQAAAGEMIIQVIKPPTSWRADLAAGQTLTLTLGPWGRLRVNLPGPDGPWRAPLTAVGPAQAPRRWAGRTQSPLPLPPGDYEVIAQVIPPLRAKASAPPGGERILDLPAVGGLLVIFDPGREPRPYAVHDTEGRKLGRGHTGQTIALQPGRYEIVMTHGGRASVAITARQLTRIDAPSAP